jgi:hypothetical protein
LISQYLADAAIEGKAQAAAKKDEAAAEKVEDNASQEVVKA